VKTELSFLQNIVLILVRYAGPLRILRVFCGQWAQCRRLAVSLCPLWCGCFKKLNFSLFLLKIVYYYFSLSELSLHVPNIYCMMGRSLRRRRELLLVRSLASWFGCVDSLSFHGLCFFISDGEYIQISLNFVVPNVPRWWFWGSSTEHFV